MDISYPRRQKIKHWKATMEDIHINNENDTLNLNNVKTHESSDGDDQATDPGNVKLADMVQTIEISDRDQSLNESSHAVDNASDKTLITELKEPSDEEDSRSLSSTGEVDESMEQEVTEDVMDLSLQMNADDHAMFKELIEEDVKSGYSQLGSDRVDLARERAFTNQDDTGEIVCDELLERKSELHCAFCGDFCQDARMLMCLHSFCLGCLEKKTEKRHRYIFCGLCNYRTMIPKDGLASLPINIVITNRITSPPSSQVSLGCMVCQLVNHDNKSVMKCLDCGDYLCEDCGSKHTFSRLTAKHTVVSLEEDMSDSDDSTFMNTKKLRCCQIHNGEEVKFYCEKCGLGICRDCVSASHQTHSHIDITVACKKARDNIEAKFDALKKRAKFLEDDDIEEDLRFIEEEEEKQRKCVEDAKTEIIEVVKKKFDSYLNQLQQEFESKRDFCKKRKKFMEKKKKVVNCVAENVDFFLKVGRPVELIAMETALTKSLVGQENDLRSVFPKVQHSHSFPTVEIISDSSVVEGMSFVKVQKKNLNLRKDSLKNSAKQHQDGPRNPGQKENTPRDHKHIANAHQNQNQTGQHDQQSLLSMPRGTPCRTSIGRGKLLELTPSSLLGEYKGHLGQIVKNMPKDYGYGQPQTISGPSLASQHGFHGQNEQFQQFSNRLNFQASPVQNADGCMMNRVNDRASPFSSVHTQPNWNVEENQRFQNTKSGYKHSSGGKGRHKEPRQLMFEKLQPPFGVEHITLKLKGTINVNVLLEYAEPEVKGLTFTSSQVFAVSDGSNRRVKLFDTGGKFLTVIEDEGPMSITACQDHLIWNSQFSDVKIYSLTTMEGVDCRTFSGASTHPVTTFKREKLLVANVHGSYIEAYEKKGTSYKCIHTLEPRDRNGRVLKHVTHIAAYSKDQLVLVDSAVKKLVVTDFDGHCIGEYSNAGWEPGGVAIDHHDNIFVTDKGRNKLLALTSRAEFIQEWRTLVDSPYAVACNKMGLLVVAGNGRNINIYQYE